MSAYNSATGVYLDDFPILYMCVLILLYVSAYYYMRPHTTSSSVTGVYLDDFPIERVPKDELGMYHSFFF